MSPPLYYHIKTLALNVASRYDHILAYLRSPPTTADHVAALPHAVQLHAATPARLEALLALRDEAVYLDLPELAQLCATELRRYPNFHAAQLSRTSSSSHVVVAQHTRGQSTSSSMRSMDTLREHDEDNAEAEAAAAAADAADIASTSTGRDSFGSAKSAGSARGRGRTRNTPQPPPPPPTLPPPLPKRRKSRLLIRRRLRSSIVGSLAKVGSVPS